MGWPPFMGLLRAIEPEKERFLFFSVSFKARNCSHLMPFFMCARSHLIHTVRARELCRPENLYRHFVTTVVNSCHKEDFV